MARPMTGILASSVGYFFLSGLKVFAVVFAVHQYGLSPSTSSAPVLASLQRSER